MKNTIEPHQELENALLKCFHIKFQQHKEIMEGGQSKVGVREQEQSRNSALGHIVFFGRVQCFQKEEDLS